MESVCKYHYMYLLTVLRVLCIGRMYACFQGSGKVQVHILNFGHCMHNYHYTATYENNISKTYFAVMFFV